MFAEQPFFTIDPQGCSASNMFRGVWQVLQQGKARTFVTKYKFEFE